MMTEKRLEVGGQRSEETAALDSKPGGGLANTREGQMGVHNVSAFRSHPLRCPFPSCVSKFSEPGEGSSVRVEEQSGGWIAQCQDCCSGTGSFHSQEAALDEWNRVAFLCQRTAFDPQMHFTYADLWTAYETGAKDAHAHWHAGERDFKRSADAYCKLIHAERDPEMFDALSVPSMEPAATKSEADSGFSQTSFETGGRNALNLQMDTARLDWLERQVVEVRTPLRYGSQANFICSPEEQDGEPDLPSDIRQSIDKALQDARAASDGKEQGAG